MIDPEFQRAIFNKNMAIQLNIQPNIKDEKKNLFSNI